MWECIIVFQGEEIRAYSNLNEQEARDWLALKENSARARGDWVLENINENTTQATRVHKNGLLAPKQRTFIIRRMV